MIELSGIELLVPVIVSALVVVVRNISAKLDGPVAYYFVLGLNVLGQVIMALAADGTGATAATLGSAAMLGVGTGATVSVGVATAGKRLGAGKIVKPKRTA